MAAMHNWNGWRRIWIVVSAAALLFAVVTAINSVSPNLRVDQEVVSGFDDPQCKYIVDLPTDLLPAQEPAFNEPCWSMYLYRQMNASSAKSSVEYRHDIQRRRRKETAYSLTVFLTIWLVGIGLLYGAGLVVAWIRRGFAQPND